MTDLDELRKRVARHEPFNIADVTDKDPLIRDLWRWGLEQMHNADYWAGLALHGYEPVTADMLAEAMCSNVTAAQCTIDRLGPPYRQRKT
jgi:hypothetical protein